MNWEGHTTAIASRRRHNVRSYASFNFCFHNNTLLQKTCAQALTLSTTLNGDDKEKTQL